MKVSFQDLEIRFKTPILMVGEVHEFEWVDAELVVVEIGPSHNLLAIAERSAETHDIVYTKLFNEKWQFVVDQRHFSVKWGLVNGLPDSEILPEIRFRDYEQWWIGIEFFRQLRESAGRQCASIQQAREEFYQHLEGIACSSAATSRTA